MIVLLFFIACAATRLHAQGYASIVGTVTDPTGAVIPSATVTAVQTQTGHATVVTAGKDGAYVFPALLPSTYSISVTAQGFEQSTQAGIVLQADQALTVNVKLNIGAATTTVEVESSVPQVNTTSGTLSQVIDEASVVDMPLNGRDAATLITLVAGVVDATNEGNGVNQGNGKTFPAVQVSSTNGTLPNQYNFLLDGGNNVDEMTNVNGPYPIPGCPAGIQRSNQQLQRRVRPERRRRRQHRHQIRRSKFHGDAFEFLRNGYFNAESILRRGTQDNLHRHQFGGTIGGPVIIPHFSRGTARSSSSAISTQSNIRTQTPRPRPSPPSLKKASLASPTLTSATSAPPATPTTSATPQPSASPIRSPTSPIR